LEDTRSIAKRAKKSERRNFDGGICPICKTNQAITFDIQAGAFVPLSCATCHPLPRTSRETDAGNLRFDEITLALINGDIGGI